MNTKVPWTDWREWLRVYAQICKDPPQALRPLESWRLRAALPVRVECTRMLLSVLTLDSSSEPQLLALCMVVVRTVNQLCDLSLARTNQSLASKATLIELPEYIVDLRHAAAHGELPEETLVRKASVELLDYLVEHYWKRQYELYTAEVGKTEKQLARFAQKARFAQDIYSLAPFTETNFTALNEQHRDVIARRVVKMRRSLSEPAWALLFLHLNNKVPKLAESILARSLQLLQSGKLSYSEVSASLTDLVALEPSISLSSSPQLKQLLMQNNTIAAAHALLQELLHHNTLASPEALKQLYSLSLCESTTMKDSSPTPPLPFKRWRQPVTWQPSPLGSQSILNR